MLPTRFGSIALIFLAPLVVLHNARAQPDTVRPQKWYDTLTVTSPRYAGETDIESLALAAFTAISIPAGVVVLTTLILPPSGGVLLEEGEWYGGGILSTGFGFTHDTTDNYFWPDARVQIEGAWFPERKRSLILRSSLLFDARLARTSKHAFYWWGVALGGGLSTDFAGVSPYAELFVGVMNPMGIRYITHYPMHHFGLRGRAGFDPVTSRAWYEVSFAATSTFWF